MLVQGPSNICTHRWSIPIDTFGSVATGGNSNGCERGVGEGVGVGVAVGEAVGVGLGIDVVYWIASAGGMALSRVSNRFAVALPDSSPRTSQPKLMVELSSHDCTSATICAELQV